MLKALALGAEGVCFANLLVLAFMDYGEDGVANMLKILYRELQRVMSYTGRKSVKEIIQA